MGIRGEGEREGGACRNGCYANAGGKFQKGTVAASLTLNAHYQGKKRRKKEKGDIILPPPMPLIRAISNRS